MYGDVKDSVGGKLTGEVDGYALVHYGLNETGSLDLHFKKTTVNGKEILLRGRIYPVDATKVTPYQEQTQEEAVKTAITRLNRTIKNLIRNYVSEEEYSSAMKVVNSFETLVEATKNLLPAGFATKTGRLVVGFNKTGFLSFPTSMAWDKDTQRHLPFFSTNPEQQLRDMPNNLTLQKPVIEEIVESSDDLPF